VISLLWMITVILLVLWVLGFAVNLGAWINFLLVVGVILVIFNVICVVGAVREPPAGGIVGKFTNRPHKGELCPPGQRIRSLLRGAETFPVISRS